MHIGCYGPINSQFSLVFYSYFSFLCLLVVASKRFLQMFHFNITFLFHIYDWCFGYLIFTFQEILLLFSEHSSLIVSCSCFIHTYNCLILWFPALKSFTPKLSSFVLLHTGEWFSSWAVSQISHGVSAYIYK